MALESLLFHSAHRGWTVVALCAIVVVGVIDYSTGPEITFSVFYLVPVAVAAWLSGIAMALAASALAAATWLLAEVTSSRATSSAFVYAWNFGARLLFLLLVAVLIAEMREMLVRERTLSRTDPVTALPNARAFRELADAEIARAARYGDPLSVAFIDIDDFKRINDTWGHAAGDRLLACIGRAIRSHVRASDVVARYGGDEYVLLLPVTDEHAARIVVAKLADEARRACAAHGDVTLSIGVVSCGAQRLSVDFLLERADALMYEVKAAGKNGARYTTSSA